MLADQESVWQGLAGLSQAHIEQQSHGRLFNQSVLDPCGYYSLDTTCNADQIQSQDGSTSLRPPSSLPFDPSNNNFSSYQRIWIRKPTQDIVGRVLLVAPIVLLGILGNLVIIYSMCRFKPFRSKPTNIFILNLAVADLLTTLVCPTAALIKDIHQFYVLGPFICRFEGFVKVTCLLVSSYSLIVLSTDWLLCVVKPCRSRITIRQSWITVAAIWLGAVMLASPLFVWRRYRERQWLDLLEIWCCETIEHSKYYWVLITFLLIYLPTIFMTLVLLIILAQMDKFEAKLRKSRTFPGAAPGRLTVSNGQAQGSAANQLNNSLTINIKYRRRIVKILFTYLLTSLVCWTPLQFTIIYRHFRTEPIPSAWFFELVFYAQLSASLTAAMNPIIFGFLSQSFRQAVTSWIRLRLRILDRDQSTKPESRRTSKRDQLQVRAGACKPPELKLSVRAKVAPFNSTTSFVRNQWPVSMHSINIEEPHQEQTVPSFGSRPQ